MDINKLIGSFKFKTCRALGLKQHLGAVDRGILKVAFMIAALDGEVTDDEYTAFDALARKCRGYTPENAAETLTAAMRSAGYLMLLAKRVTTPELVKAFMAEAKAALPNGFAYCSSEDVHRAIVTWIAVGLSDGDYSARERACIKALCKLFAELKVMRSVHDAEQRTLLTLDFRGAYYGGITPQGNVRIEKDFVERVEELMSRYDDTAAAAKTLKELIAE